MKLKRNPFKVGRLARAAMAQAKWSNVRRMPRSTLEKIPKTSNCRTLKFLWPVSEMGKGRRDGSGVWSKIKNRCISGRFEADRRNGGLQTGDLRSGLNTKYKEFDPGSGRTLAARLTHASRTGLYEMKFSDGILYSLVADG